MEPRKGCRICMRDLPPGAPNSRDYFCRRASPPSGSNLQILQPTSSSVEPCGIDTSIPAQSSGPSHSNPDISHDLLYSGRTYFEKKDFWRGEKMRGVTAREVALDIHSSKHTPQSKRLRDDELFWVQGWTYLDHVAGCSSVYCGSDRGVLSIRTGGVGMSDPKSCSGARRTEHPQEQQRQPDMCKVLSYHEILLFETDLSFVPSLTNATIRLF